MGKRATKDFIIDISEELVNNKRSMDFFFGTKTPEEIIQQAKKNYWFDMKFATIMTLLCTVLCFGIMYLRFRVL